MNPYWSLMRLAGNIWYRIERWNRAHSRYDGVTAVSTGLVDPPYTCPSVASTWPRCPACRSFETGIVWSEEHSDLLDSWHCEKCSTYFTNRPKRPV